MKLEVKARVILDVTRAKAKQYEFGIDEKHHIELPQDPKRLLVFTVGILGELAALESRKDDKRHEYRLILKEQLVLAGQYFESMSTARLTPETDEYLRILSSASYYLADMPGSSLVLARSISDTPNDLTNSKLERLLTWLLKSDLSRNFSLSPTGAYNHQIRSTALAYRAFTNLDADLFDVEDELSNIRRLVYSGGTDRELLLVDTIAALIKRKIDNSSLVCLPKYSGLSVDHWKQTLANDRFIKEFWPGQRLIGKLGVLRGASAVMQMPTSAGKTKSAELIIRSAFLSGRAKLAIIVAPFRALCREITQGFMHTFEYDSVNVNELRDITNVDDDEQEFLKFLLGEAYKGKYDHTIIVSTPEKLVYLLRHEPSLAEKIDLLIFDEGHQFDSGKRGVTYELLIASLKETIPSNTQKVLISAVMSNAETIGEWLNGESSVNIQGSNWLPSIKSVAFLSWITDMGQLSYLGRDNKYDSGLYVPKIIQQVNLGRRGLEKNDFIFPIREKTQTISCYLGLKLCHQGPVAIFCGDKRSVVTLCKTVVKVYDRGLPTPKPSEISDEKELAKIAFLSKLHFSDKHIFSEAIPLGVLPHSSAVPNGLRIAIEWAMDRKAAHLVICTSTLAQGVNLPIKYLLVSSVMQAGRRISTREFQNLIGRAGRSGYHTEGGIIFTDPKVYDGRHNWKGRFKWKETLKLLDFNNSEACLSSLIDIIKPFIFEQAKDDLLEFVKRPAARRTEWLQWGLASKNDVTELMKEMDTKEQTLNAIESYFLSMLKDDDSLLKLEVFLDLAKETLAYYLAEDDEKARLLAIFAIIHTRLQSVPPEKFPYYGKTLLGLDQLRFIEDWIDENLWDLELSESPQELLNVYWPLIAKFSISKVISNIRPENHAVEIAKRWCNGDSYHSILTYARKRAIKVQAKTQIRNITQEHIVDFCSALSYDGMLLVGGLADIVEGKSISDVILTNARSLQNQLKFGLSDEFHMWLYGQGYSDREVSKHIAENLEKVMSANNTFDFKILKVNQGLFADILSKLPTVFSEVKVR
ncbi:Replicative superfamily II helicase [Pseudomonas asturiensis]|uniref:Replicative superfamily II helicase n=1 Tax=Pseudomonas asturiensis TaxID=1190415 RepID=A0A1M7PAV2_9PSED|nr:DEAD/DEAH box helicase [Pseudomonas asturiensis]SHN13897.1 Replicative superfamily II helicase [Pseudomonas asturiensis]